MFPASPDRVVTGRKLSDGAEISGRRPTDFTEAMKKWGLYRALADLRLPSSTAVLFDWLEENSAVELGSKRAVTGAYTVTRAAELGVTRSVSAC